MDLEVATTSIYFGYKLLLVMLQLDYLLAAADKSSERVSDIALSFPLA